MQKSAFLPPAQPHSSFYTISPLPIVTGRIFVPHPLMCDTPSVIVHHIMVRSLWWAQYQRALSLSVMCGQQQADSCLRVRKRAFPKADCAAPDLGHPSFQNLGIMLFKPSRLWCFVIAASIDQYTHKWSVVSHCEMDDPKYSPVYL